jgi:tetratricopeptide (TPR) repeat protein
MKKITLLLFLCISLSTLAEQPLFTKANIAYANDSITEAIALYDSISATGRESSELYYNLGNCYYKNKNWANAIWHYEKSLQLNNNKKAKENLALTKLKIIDRIEALPQLFYKKWRKITEELLSTKHWQYLAILSIFLALFFGAMNKLLNKNTKKYYIFFLTIALLLLLISSESYQNKIDKKEGIILSSVAVINSAPTLNSTELFTLHSGTKLEITDRIDDWIHIKIANGDSGWILQNSVKEL